jgi:N-acetylglucosaminyldiphosphoundecaprenol N-acetyl-beta-D-mannosaminyltransferase
MAGARALLLNSGEATADETAMTSTQLPGDPPGEVVDFDDGQPAPPHKREPHARRSWMVDYGSRRVLGMRVDATTYRETTDAATDMAIAGHGGMICVANVHMVMEAFDDPAFRQIVNSADRVTPDGMPLVLALRRMGIPQAERVYGPTLTPIVCQRAAELGLPVGFYGGTRSAVEAVVTELSRRHPKLRIPFAFSPPFRPLDAAEDASVVEAIQEAGVKILFVGLGCPKQERWMAAHRDALGCVMLGVGAAFDFIAGRKRQAPAWLQRRGLEWFFRLCAEPLRLWRRYLIGNPRFLYHFALERLRARSARGAATGRRT